MESPKKIKSELDSRTNNDREVLMMGRKTIRHTITPRSPEKTKTIIMDRRGLKPYSV
jgi:hypothetical protein